METLLFHPTRNPSARLAILSLVFLTMQACTGSDPSPVVGTGNITTIAGVAGDFDYRGDGGLATLASLGYVISIATDAAGNIYFVDGSANVVRKINRSTGNVEKIAGTFLGFNVTDPTPHAGDGGQATEAHLNVPLGVAVDLSGNVYIADAANHIIRKISGTTGIITTLAGQPGVYGYSGDEGPATGAKLYTPYDVAVDPSGNVFIVDSQNHTIRKVEAATGIITTFAGMAAIPSGGYTGDGGPATSATFNSPQGIAVDAAGNVFVVDAGNHVVRKISVETGIISTFAGSADYGYSGDGGAAASAKMYAPCKIAVDAAGDVYIADQGSHVIRKVSASNGIISTLAGTGAAGYSGDGGPASSAKLKSPQAIAVDASGNVFITDTGNSVIRAVRQD